MLPLISLLAFALNTVLVAWLMSLAVGRTAALMVLLLVPLFFLAALAGMLGWERRKRPRAARESLRPRFADDGRRKGGR